MNTTDAKTIDVFSAFCLSQTTGTMDEAIGATSVVDNIVTIHNKGPMPFRCNGYTIPVGKGRRFRFGTKAWYICPKRPGQWSGRARGKRTMRRARAWLRSHG